MGDDGSAHVPLGFSFPFYGQTFTQSWMYDNGVISFKQPGTPGALSPWQWNSQQLKDAMASHFIASLWADIAPGNGTTYTTQGDASSMKYSWNNIRQYYGGAPALNTFTTVIKADGSISTSYYSLGLNMTNVSVGTVGDHTQGQFDQKYYAPAGTLIVNGTIADWGTAAAPPPVDPCKDNPLYSPKCPGYGAAYLASVQPQTTTTTAPTVVETISSPTPEVVTAPVQQTVTQTTTAPTSSPTQTAAASQQTAPVASSSSNQTQASSKPAESSRSTSTVSLSTILNIVRSEQSRIASVEKSVTQEAVSTALAASQSAREGAESVAATASSAASSGTGLSLAGFGNQSSSKTVSLGSAFSMSTTDRLVIDFMQERNQLMDQQQQSQQNESVKKNVQNNEAAAGVNIASLATQPVGYASYFVMMPDNVFYQPKEIYKNQSVVDNARALRQMSADRLHRDLVDLQYNRKGN